MSFTHSSLSSEFWKDFKTMSKYLQKLVAYVETSFPEIIAAVGVIKRRAAIVDFFFTYRKGN